jgi:RND family efflux transporter MFP subunit
MASEDKSALDELRSLKIERGEPRPVERTSEWQVHERPPRRVPWGWLVTLVILVGAVLTLQGPARRWYAEQTAPPIETQVAVRTGGLPTVLAASGYVNADAVVAVGTTLSGRVRLVYVKKGDLVHAGQPLAQLEDDELRAELGVQRANLARDERTLARQEQLGKSGATTQEALDNARSQVGTDRASIDLILARLKQTRILSPIDGKVLDRQVEPGDIVTPGVGRGSGIVLSLADMRKTVVEVDVNEADIGKLEVGQPAEATLDAYPDHPYRARLREFAPMADKAKATVQVKVLLEEPDDRVRPGLSAKVVFRPRAQAKPEPPRILLPRKALLGGRDELYVVAGGRIERREVTTRPGGARDAVEIVRGVEDGERVVVSGQAELRPGQKVPTRKE